jgi:hypothetical protein
MKRIGAVLLLCLGVAQIAGDLSGIAALKGIASATGASPAPKVFSAVRGLETYSTRFFIEWKDSGGRTHSLELTPKIYARLAGPYNRRNVYGAVLAYGPVLSTDPKGRPMFDAVARYALCGDAPLLRELDIDPALIAPPVRLRLEPRAGAQLGNLPLVLEPQCG